VGGVCETSCVSGFADCDDSVPGCEGDLSSPAHCGSCGITCPMACSVGMCVASCGDATNCSGSCVDIDVSLAHCGGCDMPCPSFPGTTLRCVAGACEVSSCPPGRADCDAMGNNGCEADLTVNAANCGACGAVCAAGDACMAGSCTPLTDVCPGTWSGNRMMLASTDCTSSCSSYTIRCSSAGACVCTFGMPPAAMTTVCDTATVSTCREAIDLRCCSVLAM